MAEKLARTLRRPSAWVLVTANLLLIPAAIVWDWSVFDLVFLYWLENVLIGAMPTSFSVVNIDEPMSRH